MQRKGCWGKIEEEKEKGKKTREGGEESAGGGTTDNAVNPALRGPASGFYSSLSEER